MGLVLLILLILLIVLALPTWPYSRGWGYRPMGFVTLLLLVLLVLIATDVISFKVDTTNDRATIKIEKNH